MITPDDDDTVLDVARNLVSALRTGTAYRLRINLERLTETMESILDGGQLDLWDSSEMVKQIRADVRRARRELDKLNT